MLSNRQKLVLKAIIDLFSEDGVAVGSSALTKLPYLDFSSATIRYDMAELEELGYLEKRHTSSGRVPSNLGYQYYIENLITRDNVVSEMYPLIDEFFENHLKGRIDALAQALELVAKLTGYTAVAIGPDRFNEKIRKLDLIQLKSNTSMILVVTDKGNVVSQKIETSKRLSHLEISNVISTFDDLFKNRTIKECVSILKSDATSEEFLTYQFDVTKAFLAAFMKFATDNFYLAGMTNIFEQPEFKDLSQIKRLIEMLDRKKITKMLLDIEKLTIKFGNRSEILPIILGADDEILPIDNMTMISVPYLVSNEQKGVIAILGPARMPYKKVIPLLEYISVSMAKLHASEEG
jgi:heat-inducible transcriptional repressor